MRVCEICILLLILDAFSAENPRSCWAPPMPWLQIVGNMWWRAWIWECFQAECLPYSKLSHLAKWLCRRCETSHTRQPRCENIQEMSNSSRFLNPKTANRRVTEQRNQKISGYFWTVLYPTSSPDSFSLQFWSLVLSYKSLGHGWEAITLS